MDCHEFEVRLESLLDGRLENVERDACQLHAETCPACGELLEAVGDPEIDASNQPVESLVDAVLASTVGSACGQARERLPAFVDQELVAADRELVDLHMDSCTRCRQLASTLTQLRRELPRLAEAPVDDRFTAQVLAATLPRKTRSKRWWEAHWSDWVQRPRFAMEAAYVGLLVVILVLGVFSTPVAALPQKGVELMQPEPDTPSVWIKTQEGLGTFWEWVASMFEKVEKEQKPTKESP